LRSSQYAFGVVLAQCGHTGEKRPVMTCFKLFVYMRYGVTKPCAGAWNGIGTSDLFLRSRFVLLLSSDLRPSNMKCRDRSVTSCNQPGKDRESSAKRLTYSRLAITSSKEQKCAEAIRTIRLKRSRPPRTYSVLPLRHL